MKKLLLPAVLVVVAFVGWWLYSLQQMVVEESSNIGQLENALADGRMIAIAHLNYLQVRKLSESIYGDTDQSMLPMTIEDNVLGLLANEMPIDDVAFTIHMGEGDEEPVSSFVLVGEIQPLLAIEKLTSIYDIKPLEDNWYQVKPIPTEEEKLCPNKKPRRRIQTEYLYLDPTLVFISADQTSSKSLVERYKKSFQPLQSIEDWQTFRKGSIASVLATSLEHSAEGLSGISGFILKQKAKENGHVGSVAFKASVDMFSAGIVLEGQLNTGDQTWKLAKAKAAREAIDNASNNTKAVSPTLAELIKGVSIQSNEKGITSTVTLNAATVNNLSDIFKESLSYVFGGLSGDEEQEKESIDDEPLDYSLNEAFVTLPPSKNDFSHVEPLYKDGPFSIDIDDVRKTDKGILEMALVGRVTLPEMPDDVFGKSSGTLSMRIDSAVDAQGESLLRDERCIDSMEVMGGLNHEESDMGYRSSESMTVHKHIRFRQDQRLQNLSRIKGSITFKSPTKVASFEVPLKAGERVKHNGVEFYLSSVRKQQVSYQLSGDIEKLLEVRAFNKDKKPLSRSWGFGEVGGAQKVQAYRGDIASLTIYILEKETVHHAEFDLTNLFDYRQDALSKKAGISSSEEVRRVNIPGDVDMAKWEELLQQDIAKLEIDKKRWPSHDRKLPHKAIHWQGVKALMAHKIDSPWSNGLDVKLYYPALNGLAGNLSSFEYVLEIPANEATQGKYYKPVLNNYDLNTGAPVFDHELNGVPYHAYALGIDMGDAQKTKLDRIKGAFIFRIPSKVKSHSFDVNELWEPQTVDDISVVLESVSWGLFRGYSLKVSGNLDKLVYVNGVKGDGGRIKPDPINLQEDGYWTMTIPFHRDMNSIEVIVAEEQKVYQYPFDFKPEYGQRN